MAFMFLHETVEVLKDRVFSSWYLAARYFCYPCVQIILWDKPLYALFGLYQYIVGCISREVRHVTAWPHGRHAVI